MYAECFDFKDSPQPLENPPLPSPPPQSDTFFELAALNIADKTPGQV